MKLRQIITSLLLFILLPNLILGQDIYRTVDGDIVITGAAADSNIILKSNDLLILLDYETAEFTLKVDKSSFYTGNDSIDKKFSIISAPVVEFKGKLGLDYINPKGQLPVEFNVEGSLSHNKSNILYGNGKLESMGEASLYSLYLNMTFHLKTSDLAMQLPIEDMHEPIQIEIVQALLKKEKK